MLPHHVLLLAALLALVPSPPPPPADLTFPDGQPFAIGSLTGLIQVWLDPLNGNDAASGATRATALKSLSAAWAKVPMDTPLTTGFHIRITAGNMTVAMQPNYWERRYGTRAAPIVIEGADPGRAAHLASVNIFDVQYLYFMNVAFDVETSDQVHCEQCTALLLRDVTVTGQRGSCWEAIKLNQCTGVYIENSDISGADDNAIDVFAVRYGHILDSKIHNANWCIYHKGGAAHHLVARNEVYDCGESGYAAGQGSGLEYMVAPWLRYESYDIRVINNVIHNVWGAALGVYGSHRVLLAHNTLYKVGSRSHAIEALLGGRQCDGATTECATRNALGGWGSTSANAIGTPTNQAWIVNNIIYNPPPYKTLWQHITVANSEAVTQGTNVPGPRARADTALIIAGNIFWNGDATMPIGVESWSDGCGATTSCNLTTLQAGNAWNTIDPGLTGPDSKPSATALASFTKLWTLNDWSAAWDGALGEPAGPTGNAVPYDRIGTARAGKNAPGAYAI